MREIAIDLGKMPKGWNELTEKQLRRVTEALLKSFPKVRFRLEMLRVFTGLLILQKPHTYRNETPHFLVKFPHCERCYVSVDAIRDMGASFDWLLEASDLYVQKLPEVECDGKVFYGPDDALANISFNEYVSANELYTAYVTTKRERYLDMLIAVMYRPEAEGYDCCSPDCSGDRREAFNPFTYEARAEELRKLDVVTKTIMLFYYTGCRRELQRRFPDVFTGDSSGDSKKGIPGLAGLVSRLNGGDPTKNEGIRNTALYDILEELQKNEEITQRMKER